MATITLATRTIPQGNVARLMATIDKISRRAVRLRAAPFDVFVSDPYVIKVDSKSIWMCDVVVEGEVIALSGWTLAAKFDFIDADSMVVSKAPGFEDLLIDRSSIAPTRCDHCNTARRRATSYLVQNETGSRKIVGSTCLPDFTGMGRSAEAVLSINLEVISAMDDEDLGRAGGSSRALDLVKYLTCVSAVIRAYGWMSRTRARESYNDVRSTSEITDAFMNVDKPWEKYPEVEVTRRDAAIALRAIHWACEQSGNDYADNIAALASASYCSPRHMGIAASIVASWQRHRGELHEQARKIQVNPSATMGVAREKIATYAEIVRKRYLESEWGVTTQVVMTDVQTGASIIWWASGDTDDFVEGERVQIAATIKKIEDYKGTLQTVVTRCCVLRHWVAEKKVSKSRAKTKADALG